MSTTRITRHNQRFLSSLNHFIYLMVKEKSYVIPKDDAKNKKDQKGTFNYQLISDLGERGLQFDNKCFFENEEEKTIFYKKSIEEQHNIVKERIREKFFSHLDITNSDDRDLLDKKYKKLTDAYNQNIWGFLFSAMTSSLSNAVDNSAGLFTKFAAPTYVFSLNHNRKKDEFSLDCEISNLTVTCKHVQEPSLNGEYPIPGTARSSCTMGDDDPYFKYEFAEFTNESLERSCFEEKYDPRPVEVIEAAAKKNRKTETRDAKEEKKRLQELREKFAVLTSYLEALKQFLPQVLNQDDVGSLIGKQYLQIEIFLKRNNNDTLLSEIKSSIKTVEYIQEILIRAFVQNKELHRGLKNVPQQESESEKQKIAVLSNLLSKIEEAKKQKSSALQELRKKFATLSSSDETRDYLLSHLVSQELEQDKVDLLKEQLRKSFSEVKKLLEKNIYDIQIEWIESSIKKVERIQEAENKAIRSIINQGLLPNIQNEEAQDIVAQHIINTALLPDIQKYRNDYFAMIKTEFGNVDNIDFAKEADQKTLNKFAEYVYETTHTDRADREEDLVHYENAKENLSAAFKGALIKYHTFTTLEATLTDKETRPFERLHKLEQQTETFAAANSVIRSDSMIMSLFKNIAKMLGWKTQGEQKTKKIASSLSKFGVYHKAPRFRGYESDGELIAVRAEKNKSEEEENRRLSADDILALKH